MSKTYKIVIDDRGDTGGQALSYVKEELRQGLNQDIEGLENEFDIYPSDCDENAVIVEPNKEYQDEIEEALPKSHRGQQGDISYKIEVIDSKDFDYDEIPESERERYENNLKDLRERAQFLQEQIEEKNQEIDDLEQEIEEAEEVQESIKEDARKKQSKLDGLRGEYEKTKRKLEHVRNINDEKDEEIERLEQELDEAVLEPDSQDKDIDEFLEGKAEDLEDDDTDLDFAKAYEAAMYSEINYIDIHSEIDREEIAEVLDEDEVTVWSNEDQEELNEAEEIYKQIQNTEYLDEEDIGDSINNIEDKISKLRDKKNNSLNEKTVSKVESIREEYSDIRNEIKSVIESIGEFNVGLIEENNQYKIKIPQNQELLSRIVKDQIEDRIDTDINYDESGCTKDLLMPKNKELTGVRRKVSSSITGGLLDNLNLSLTVQMSFNNSEENEISMREEKESFIIEGFLRGIKDDEDMPEGAFRNISNEAANMNYENPVKAVLNDWDEIYGRTEELQFEDSEKVREMSVIEEARERWVK